MIAGKSLIVIAAPRFGHYCTADRRALPPFVQQGHLEKRKHGKQVKVAGWDLSDATLHWPESLRPEKQALVSVRLGSSARAQRIAAVGQAEVRRLEQNARNQSFACSEPKPATVKLPFAVLCRALPLALPQVSNDYVYASGIVPGGA
jgi:hypothetical protein